MGDSLSFLPRANGLVDILSHLIHSSEEILNSRSCAISLIVRIPRTASIAILTLNSAVRCLLFRFISSFLAGLPQPDEPLDPTYLLAPFSGTTSKLSSALRLNQHFRLPTMTNGILMVAELFVGTRKRSMERKAVFAKGDGSLESDDGTFPVLLHH